MSSPSHTPLSRIRKALAGGHPLVHVRCDDEERLERLLGAVARQVYGDEQAFHQWSLTTGLVRACAQAPGAAQATDPLEALRAVLARSERGFYLFKDLPLLLDERPDVVRALRDAYRALSGKGTHVFLSCSDYRLPRALEREVFLVELGAPDEAEMLAELQRVAQALSGPDTPALDASLLPTLAAAMRGMMLNEARHLMRRLIREHKLALDTALGEIRDEKASVLMRESCLKYIANTVDIARVGGLENLKEWVLNRAPLFCGADAAGSLGEQRIPLPAGVLFMGVSGCGKSMAAKVIASAWQLPLVRLDMNLVLSGAHGSPEYAFDHALRMAEQVAPLVLWIDELENSFGYDSEQRSGNNPNIFSSFLTWMQEKPEGVFVVATANRIEKLPAEVIRKGRFDQLFFLDLPTEAERMRIIDIHLRSAGAGAGAGTASAFNLAALAAVTKNWSGAEIEQGIRAAVVHAWQENRPFTERDVMWSMSRIVPLSRTMAEQIKALRAWSAERATPASLKEG